MPAPRTLTADELTQALRIAERLSGIGYEVRNLLRDTTRAADESPALRDALGAALFFLSGVTDAAAEAYQTVDGHLRAAKDAILTSGASNGPAH